MKRTRTLALTSLMAVGGVSLTACGDNADNVRIEHPGKSVDAYAYQSIEECKAKDEVPDSACDKAEAAAKDDETKAAKYDNQSTCEDVYGQGQCVPRSAANGGGGSFWGPAITGFVVGQMLNGGWGGRGYYRDWRDGGFYSVSGGRMYTDYSTGKTRLSTRSFDPPDTVAPSRIVSRSGAISRGGFGGRMSSRSFGGSHGGFGG